MGIIGDYAEMDRIRQRRESINGLRRDGFLVIRAPKSVGPAAPQDAEGIAEMLSDVSRRIADKEPLTATQAYAVLDVLEEVMKQLTPPEEFYLAGIGGLS